MPDGLKIVVGADVVKANQAITQFETHVVDAFKDVTSAGQQMGNRLPPAINKANVALNRFSKTSSSATQATINLGRVVQDAPYGFLGIANNLNPLLESFQRLKVETGSTKGALKALGSSLTGAGGLGLALSLVTTGILLFTQGFQSFSKKATQAKEATDQLKESIKGVFSSVAKEATEVGSLVTVLRSETETRERKLAAIKELQKIQPGIFSGLKLEGDAVIGLDTAYKNYLINLKNVIAAKIIQAKLEQKITKLLELQGAGQTANEKALTEGANAFEELRLKVAKGDPSQAFNVIQSILGKRSDRNKELNAIEKDIESLFKSLSEFSKAIDVKVPELKVKPDKIKVEKVKILDIADFNFEDALLRTIKIPKLKIKPDIGIITNESLDPDFLLNQIKAATEVNKQIAALFGIIGSEDSPFTKMQREAIVAAQTIQGVLVPAFEGLFSAILKGENPMKAFFQSLGNAVTQLVQKLLSAAITAAILSVIFPGGLAGAKGFGAIFGKLLGFAEGGLVTGPQLALIGEGSGTSRSNPEVVAPLDRLRSMLSNMNTGGSQVVYVTGRLRGNDMILQNARTSRSQRRATGR